MKNLFKQPQPINSLFLFFAGGPEGGHAEPVLDPKRELEQKLDVRDYSDFANKFTPQRDLVQDFINANKKEHRRALDGAMNHRRQIDYGNLYKTLLKNDAVRKAFLDFFQTEETNEVTEQTQTDLTGLASEILEETSNESALTQENANLGQRIEELEALLAEQNKASDEADETPLTVVPGANDIIQTVAADGTAEQGADAIVQTVAADGTAEQGADAIIQSVATDDEKSEGADAIVQTVATDGTAEQGADAIIQSVATNDEKSEGADAIVQTVATDLVNAGEGETEQVNPPTDIQDVTEAFEPGQLENLSEADLATLQKLTPLLSVYAQEIQNGTETGLLHASEIQSGDLKEFSDYLDQKGITLSLTNGKLTETLPGGTSNTYQSTKEFYEGRYKEFDEAQSTRIAEEVRQKFEQERRKREASNLPTDIQDVEPEVQVVEADPIIEREDGGREQETFNLEDISSAFDFPLEQIGLSNKQVIENSPSFFKLYAEAVNNGEYLNPMSFPEFMIALLHIKENNHLVYSRNNGKLVETNPYGGRPTEYDDMNEFMFQYVYSRMDQ